MTLETEIRQHQQSLWDKISAYNHAVINRSLYNRDEDYKMVATTLNEWGKQEKKVQELKQKLNKNYDGI